MAGRVGTSADTIPYYERIGVLPEAGRNPAGHRLPDETEVERVAFAKRAQRFGLQLDEIRELLDNRQRGLCPCGHADDLFLGRLDEIEQQLRSLAALRDEIREFLADDRNGEGWPCGDEFIQLPAGQVGTVRPPRRGRDPQLSTGKQRRFGADRLGTGVSAAGGTEAIALPESRATRRRRGRRPRTRPCWQVRPGPAPAVA